MAHLRDAIEERSGAVLLLEEHFADIRRRQLGNLATPELAVLAPLHAQIFLRVLRLPIGRIKQPRKTLKQDHRLQVCRLRRLLQLSLGVIGVLRGHRLELGLWLKHQAGCHSPLRVNSAAHRSGRGPAQTAAPGRGLARGGTSRVEMLRGCVTVRELQLSA